MTYPTNQLPASGIPVQADATWNGTAWVGGTVDSAAAVIEPLRQSTLALMGYLGLSGDAANPSGTITALTKALQLLVGLPTGSSVASAATVTLPTNGVFITITGTTNITDIALPVAPFTTRLVILKAASSGLIFRNGNHLQLGQDVTLQAGQTLALYCDTANWYPIGAVNTGGALTNPMTTQDDVIVGGASGVPARLAKGADGQVLTVDPTSHHLVWAASASGFANPMVAQDDVIVGGTAGTATRLAKGADGQVLTVDPTTHHLVWATPGGLTNPMTGINDLIVGGSSGTPTRLAVGAAGQVLTVNPSTGAVNWAASASGFANPMTAQDDLIVGGTSGTGTRLGKGSDGQVLTVDATTHHLAWDTPSAGGGSVGWEVNGTAVSPTRPNVNLIAGTNMTIAAADNSGASRTDVTFTSSGGGGGGASGPAMTAPPTWAGGTWTAFNGTGLTVTDQNNGIQLTNASGGTTNFRGITLAYPGVGTDWLRVIKCTAPTWSTDNQGSGLFVSDGTKVVCLALRWGSGALFVSAYQMATVTTIFGSAVGQELRVQHAGNIWLRLHHVLSSLRRIWQYSVDGGQFWFDIYSELDSNFLTPTVIGYGQSNSGDGQIVYSTLMSWDTAIPTWHY